MGDIKEKTFFDEGLIRVTNFRIIYKHETIPITKVARCYTNLKVNTMFFFIFILLVSLLMVYFLHQYAIILIVGSFVAIRQIWDRYAELWIVYGSDRKEKKVKIMTTSANNRDYVFRVADAISDAIADHAEIEKTAPPGFSVTETMRVKAMMSELEDK